MQFKTILRVVRPLLTLLEFAVSVLIIAVTAQIVFGNKLETYLITIISVVLAVSTYAIWYSDGVDRGEQVPKVYNTALRFNTYARTIAQLQVPEKQREFCEKKNQEHAQDLLIAKLTEQDLSIRDLTSYKEELQKARVDAKIKARLTLGNLHLGEKVVYPEEFINFCKKYDKKQLKLMHWLSSHTIKFAKLVPKDLTKATYTIKGIKPINTERKQLPIKLAGKVIWGVALGLLTASILFTKKGDWTINETIQVLSWAFSISLNIFTSILAGYRSVTVNRFNYYAEKIELNTEFFGFIGHDLHPIEADIQGRLKEDK